MNRTKVLQAEIIDARQQNQQLKGQVADLHRSVDDATAKVQQVEFERSEFERKYANTAGNLQELASRASSAETRAEQVARRNAELESRVDKLLDSHKRQRAEQARLLAEIERKKRAARAAPARAPVLQDDPQLASLKSDLQARMSAAGIHMPVEVRTARDGSRRVAVVLPDSFKPGKSSLAYNPAAVNAVVRLGQLVQTQYPGSAISVEGHTDADPIRKSNWASNEALSLARAQEVQKLLTDTGLEAAKISVVGVGAAQPIERGGTARAKSRNRRVEIFINP